MKAPHHRHRYHVTSRAVTAAAHADPTTRCWKCHRTIAQVRETKPRATWCSGHVTPGQVNGPMLPECTECSGREGATMTNSKRTDLTW